ncbi:hypothetical protein BVRB_2g024170 [Beta vulgaris subsp. vulgaris]|nr:hypothetical protein BVRB_2g024170 [Beta vulgaris subsp. vulgaris]
MSFLALCWTKEGPLTGRCTWVRDMAHPFQAQHCG